VTAPQVPPGYYLLTSLGVIDNYGGAALFGSRAGAKRTGKVVAGAATLDGGGYWMATTKGAVYNFGDAAYFGSAVHLKLAKPIVGFVASPDGGGYSLVAANGAVYNYGDAPFCGSAIHRKLARPITAIDTTPDGQGYWLVTAGGAVLNFGDAAYFGSALLASKKLSTVGISATPDGGGYWTATSNGAVHNFGDAAFYGSPVHLKLSSPVISITATADGHGYWLTTADGRVRNYGDAPFSGSLAHHPPPKPETVVALLRAVAVPTTANVSLPHHVLGYDISNYQCTKTGATTASNKLPTTSSISIIEAAGWLDSADNSCLASEANWANTTSGRATPYELYLFVNSPGNTKAAASIYANGPKGACGTETGTAQQLCIAYNYGYNGAKDAYAYASTSGVHALIWWLDVENSSLSTTQFSNLPSNKFWSNSKALNATTIQGALDALRQEGILVGIYSTGLQFPEIAGDFVPLGPRVPLWAAGVPLTNPPYTATSLPSTSALSIWCAGTGIYKGPKVTAPELFAGGIPWILQETPGTASSPYGLDPDYTC
jgi:hypothetical protein